MQGKRWDDSTLGVFNQSASSATLVERSGVLSREQGQCSTGMADGQAGEKTPAPQAHYSGSQAFRLLELDPV